MNTRPVKHMYIYHGDKGHQMVSQNSAAAKYLQELNYGALEIQLPKVHVIYFMSL
jgi:hypothetical protein